MNSIKYVSFSLIAFVVVGGGFILWHTPKSTSVTYEREAVPGDLGNTSGKDLSQTAAVIEQSDTGVKEIEIQPGDTFSTIMEKIDVSAEDQNSILAAVQDVYDFTKLQAGKFIHVVFAQDALASVDYDLNDDKKIVIKNVDGEFIAEEEAVEYDVVEVTKSATIESSLFIDGGAVGLSDKTLVELAEIFQWDIDFSTDIREGDSFSLVYEDRKTPDGEPVRPGKIMAAKFENQGTSYDAYYYETEDGVAGYYAANGESVERQFLSSPIGVGYISSGFSYSRVNPVTRQVTPHRALDYAAPHGTPVVAVADGEVTVAGDKGGLGITVEIRHGQYKSQYAHLSKIASGIKQGETVLQGDVVGYVGSTGISTGPHLQYALFKAGAPINPLEADLPVGESLADAELDNFQDIVDRYKVKLEAN
tara:strand:+ start:5653 stop:6909 length:1257 start_codon:yes stop_codon:yes gene_type:complete